MANLRYEVIWQYEITIVVIADLLVVSFFDVLSTHQVRREFWEYSITGNHKLAVFRYPKKIIEFSSILMFLIRTPKTGFHWAERQASKSTSNFMLVHLVKGNYELVWNVNKNVSTTFMPPARHLTCFFIWLWFGYTFDCAVPTFVHMQRCLSMRWKSRNGLLYLTTNEHWTPINLFPPVNNHAVVSYILLCKEYPMITDVSPCVNNHAVCSFIWLYDEYSVRKDNHRMFSYIWLLMSTRRP